MKLLILLCIFQAVFSFTVQVNNIHNGYRNVYIGKVTLDTNDNLILSSYTARKRELTASEISFLTITPEKLQFNFKNFVQQFTLDDIDIDSPRLLFRSEVKPQMVITVFSEAQLLPQITQVIKMAHLGQPMDQDL